MIIKISKIIFVCHSYFHKAKKNLFSYYLNLFFWNLAQFVDVLNLFPFISYFLSFFDRSYIYLCTIFNNTTINPGKKVTSFLRFFFVGKRDFNLDLNLYVLNLQSYKNSKNLKKRNAGYHKFEKNGNLFFSLLVYKKQSIYLHIKWNSKPFNLFWHTWIERKNGKFNDTP